MIAGVEPLDCGYRVVGSLLLLLAISEIIPGLAGTLGDCRMSQFIHYVWEKSLLFMLVLVGHDERSFLLQINITKDITLIVQWVKDFSMISLLHIPCIMLLYGIWIAFSILVLIVNTQPACVCVCVCMSVNVYMYSIYIIYIYIYIVYV